MTRNYLFIGGPLHLCTKPTNGDWLYTTIETDPWKVGPVPDEPQYVINYKEHNYNLIKIDIFGFRNAFYKHSLLSDSEAAQKFGVFMLSLLDLYNT